MPGFVDVTGWSSEEVRRLGHADDYDEEQYQPRRRTQPSTVNQVGYAVSDVWAAACAAQRINSGYFKEHVYEHFEHQALVEPPALVKRKNRDVMMEFLQNPSNLLVEDVEAGEELRRWLQNDLTFRALKSKLTEFDTATQKCLAVQDRFYTVGHRYELAVIASLPNSQAKALAREAAQDRLATTSSELVGNPGDKVQLDVEIVKSNYSQQWSTWYSTAVTSDNRAVFFAYRQQLGVGAKCTIFGTVKAHKDGQTQLNRVSIL
jgi:hypothetical protein